MAAAAGRRSPSDVADRAQGINMALRDAVVAANHLVPTLRGVEPCLVPGEMNRQAAAALAKMPRARWHD
jgi:hypothetical protein